MAVDAHRGRELYYSQYMRIHRGTDTQLYLVQILDFPLETDDKKNSIWHQMLFFIGAFALAYSAQFLFLLMLVELLHCNEYLAQFLGLFVYGAVNFICNRRLTFR